MVRPYLEQKVIIKCFWLKQTKDRWHLRNDTCKVPTLEEMVQTFVDRTLHITKPTTVRLAPFSHLLQGL